jgi:hypothetical protein
MRFVITVCALLMFSGPAWADDETSADSPTLALSDDLAALPIANFPESTLAPDPWRVSFQQGDPQPLHAAAIEHSDAYQTRAKIHKYASFATLPLFAVEAVLGQSLYNDPVTGGRKAAHIVIGTGIIGLFGVETVTGVWNLFGEGWQEKNGRTLRLVHGLMMMAADVGFLATAATGPNDRRGALTFSSDASTHRAIAFTSIGVGTASYLIMFFANHH